MFILTPRGSFNSKTLSPSRLMKIIKKKNCQRQWNQKILRNLLNLQLSYHSQNFIPPKKTWCVSWWPSLKIQIIKKRLWSFDPLKSNMIKNSRFSFEHQNFRIRKFSFHKVASIHLLQKERSSKKHEKKPRGLKSMCASER